MRLWPRRRKVEVVSINGRCCAQCATGIVLRFTSNKRSVDVMFVAAHQERCYYGRTSAGQWNKAKKRIEHPSYTPERLQRLLRHRPRIEQPWEDRAPYYVSWSNNWVDDLFLYLEGEPEKERKFLY